MKISPIEISIMHHLDGKSKYQISAVLNVPLFYVEKCLERFNREDALTFRTEHTKQSNRLIKKTMKQVKKKAEPLHYTVVQNTLGDKNSAYWENEMQYGSSVSNKSVEYLIAKYN